MKPPYPYLSKCPSFQLNLPIYLDLVCLFVSLPGLSICLSNCVYVCLSHLTHLSKLTKLINQSINQSINHTTNLSIYLSIYLSNYMSLKAFVDVWLMSIYLYQCWCIYLSMLDSVGCDAPVFPQKKNLRGHCLAETKRVAEGPASCDGLYK